MKAKELVNEKIRAKEVMLIDDTGVNHGTVSTSKALEMAKEKDLDLVVVSPNQAPPVAKILDWGKYKYETEKRAKEARKKQKTVDIKELRLSPSIDTHDVQVKVKKAIEFLKNGDKVKISIRFRGREIGHSKSSLVILENFAKDVEEFGIIDKAPKMEAKSLVMFLAPKN